MSGKFGNCIIFNRDNPPAFVSPAKPVNQTENLSVPYGGSIKQIYRLADIGQSALLCSPRVLAQTFPARIVKLHSHAAFWRPLANSNSIDRTSTSQSSRIGLFLVQLDRS